MSSLQEEIQRERYKGFDLRGPWHTKDWTCPHCKHQNVTLKSYDY